VSSPDGLGVTTPKRRLGLDRPQTPAQQPALMVYRSVARDHAAPMVRVSVAHVYEVTPVGDLLVAPHTHGIDRGTGNVAGKGQSRIERRH